MSGRDTLSSASWGVLPEIAEAKIIQFAFQNVWYDEHKGHFRLPLGDLRLLQCLVLEDVCILSGLQSLQGLTQLTCLGLRGSRGVWPANNPSWLSVLQRLSRFKPRHSKIPDRAQVQRTGQWTRIMASNIALGSRRLAPAQAEPRAPRPSACRPCLVRCQAKGSEASGAAQLVLPGILAAALLHASTADAGVVFEKNKGGKKFFQGAKKAAEETVKQEGSSSGGGFSLPSFNAPSLPSFSAPSLPGLPKVEGPKVPDVPSPEGFDFRFLALPGAVGFIGVAAFLASKIDPEFASFMNEGMVKDSTSFTGYEEDDPQGKGSPIGFLGLGNLDIEGFPGGIGETVVGKARSFAGTGPNRVPIPGKGGVRYPVKSALGGSGGGAGGTKSVKAPKGGKGGKKKGGLFGLGK
ncbi:hypothetical protein WJX73_002129 [Symbiochloris irregularis]|uniref:Uncharacterized protein n=1 Tax=Symbiochloris irregularis TaxID=706552 RepID=A0AAW1NTV6_9CHLO